MKRIASSLLLALAVTSCAHGADSTDTGLPAAPQPNVAARAAVFRVLHAFGGAPNGALPNGTLILLNGQLWGTTRGGGSNAANARGGTIFSYDLKTRTTRIAYHFLKGSGPYAGLTLFNGTFYGTTGGTIFSFDPATSAYRVLHHFNQREGLNLMSGLTVVNGILYGTATTGGGADFGTLFSFDPSSGTLTVIHSFAASGSPDGENPQGAPIAVNGVLYGTTSAGGIAGTCGGCGTVYAVDIASGKERVVYEFQGDIDGENPQAGLTLARGLLYGTTTSGGYAGCGDEYYYDGTDCGTVFSVVPSSGLERVVYRFGGTSDGWDPEAVLTVNGGSLYGTARGGGAGNAGTIYSINMTTRQESTLYSFPRSRSEAYPSGIDPSSTLLFVDGTYYGTAQSGGPHSSGNAGDGTLFSLKL